MVLIWALPLLLVAVSKLALVLVVLGLVRVLAHPQVLALMQQVQRGLLVQVLVLSVQVVLTDSEQQDLAALLKLVGRAWVTASVTLSMVALVKLELVFMAAYTAQRLMAILA
ncbi:hypothetical protein [Paraburkholderia graminis]